MDIYKERFSDDEIPEKIVALLDELQKNVYAEKLSAVTSVGNLYLTTALSWNDTDSNDIVRIDQGTDAGKTVITMSYHTHSFRKSVAKRQCSLKEAIDYIDLYVMRLLEEKYGKL